MSLRCAMSMASALLVVVAGGAPEVFAQERPERAARRGDKTKGEEEQIRRREEWFRASRGLDSVRRPDRLRAQAAREMGQAQRERDPALAANGETWTSLGPATMTMLSWTMGRVSGRVAAFAVHPSDENVLYLGGATGGVWKTVNGGTSWTPIFDSIGTLTIGALAVGGKAGNVVWVGTGERQSSCTSYFGQGLYRSGDGGVTFEARNGSGANELQLSYIVSIAMHPSNSQTLLVSGDAYCQPGGTRVAGGVWKTTDGGATWRRVLSGTGSDVIYEPGNPNVMYAAMTNDGVYKSTNGGETWTLSSSGMVTGGGAGRLRLAMAPSSVSTLYVLSSASRLYRSTNGAASWTQQNASACEGQCTYNLTVDVHPTSPSTVLVGTIRFSRSVNDGTTLTPLTTGWGSSQKVHQDTHVVRYSRTNGNRFWVGSDGGLWRTDDGGTNFVNLNTDINLTQFYDVAIDPADPTRVFGGAQDNSSLRRLGSQQWNVTIVTGDGFMNLVDPADVNRVFQTSYPSGGLPWLTLSNTGGGPGTHAWVSQTGMTSGEPYPWVTPLAILPNTVFVGSHSVYRATTGGPAGSYNWTKISPNLTGGSSLVVIHTIPGSTVAYAGSSNGRIQRTDDVLAPSPSWTDVTGGYPGGYVSDVAADPTNPLRVFATRGAFNLSRLYRSTTGGTTWAAVGAGLPNVPANAVSIDPLEPNRVFVGTDVGVFESVDGGDNFMPFSAGLPLGLVVTDLEVDDAPHVLVAGTYGRGAFRVNLMTAPNQSPLAAFNADVSVRHVAFDDLSTDADGVIASRLWSFGDGTTSTETDPIKVYDAPGTYSVALTVTDDDGASTTLTRAITVVEVNGEVK
jgi:hypothetical protein